MKARRSRDHFDLLPFIAIMMCLLGCLLLVTISMASINVGVGAGEVWVPGGGEQGPGKTPVLIEWDGKHVAVHRPTPDGTSSRPERVMAFASLWAMGEEFKSKHGGGPKAQISDEDFEKLKAERTKINTEFNTFVDEFEAQKATQYALFAIRPQGFETFFELLRIFHEHKIDIGYEPLSSQDKPVGLRLPPSTVNPATRP